MRVLVSEETLGVGPGIIPIGRPCTPMELQAATGRDASFTHRAATSTASCVGLLPRGPGPGPAVACPATAYYLVHHGGAGDRDRASRQVSTSKEVKCPFCRRLEAGDNRPGRRPRTPARCGGMRPSRRPRRAGAGALKRASAEFRGSADIRSTAVRIRPDPATAGDRHEPRAATVSRSGCSR
jgi:hypothetical protein